ARCAPLETAASRRSLDRLLPLAENARVLLALERDRAVLDAEHRPFAQAEDECGVFFVELADALLARLTLVRRIRIGIEVVAVELEVEDAQRVERRRLHDGHVVRRADRRT